MSKISVLGGGGWAIAISVLLYNNGHDVTIWSALKSETDSLLSERENKQALPGVIIPDGVRVTVDIEDAVKEKDIIVMAVASSYIRSTSALIKDYINQGQIIVSVAKGIEDGTLFTMSQIIENEISNADVSVLSGPTHAEEVGRGLPTTAVIGANSYETASFIQRVFSSERFRTYISPDVLGIELGGALKNIIALAAGIADGIGFGDNTKAALITRGIKEMSRLGTAMGADAYTFAGLSGIGDLVVTCASMHSRNRRAGILIGRGYSLEQAKEEVGTVVEGAVCAQAALLLAKKYNVELPIIEQVNHILFDQKPVMLALSGLMTREFTVENQESLWK